MKLTKIIMLVLFLTACTVPVFVMQAEQTKQELETAVIEGAVFFKLHMPKMCWARMSDQYFYDLNDCKNRSAIDHKKGAVIISFHDKTGALITFIDVADLMEDDEFKIVMDYAKSRLDVTAKHSAVKAFIGYNSETKEREIIFYNVMGDIIYHQPYAGTAYIGDIVAAFYDTLDLGGLEEVSDMSFYQ
jgi:hypothetical protein